jgi:hypothetical protein
MFLPLLQQTGSMKKRKRKETKCMGVYIYARLFIESQIGMYIVFRTKFNECRRGRKRK